MPRKAGAQAPAPTPMKTAELKTCEVSLLLLVHAQSLEEVQLTLAQCIPPDLRLAATEVQYCQEGRARVTCN